MKGAVSGWGAKNEGPKVESVGVLELTEATWAKVQSEDVVRTFVPVEQICGVDFVDWGCGVAVFNVPKLFFLISKKLK